MERFNGLITGRDRQRQTVMEKSYRAEIPYLEQTISWREGMRYCYSPDSYPLTRNQYQQMCECGELVGSLIPDNTIEFRLDFVKSISNQLYITEIQTDDRGIPAMAAVRNTKGTLQSDSFPGLPETFVKALEQKARKPDFTLAIIYPSKERFYYSGFYDFANICRIINPKCEIIITSETEPFITLPNIVKMKIPLTGLSAYYYPDFTWTFDTNLFFDNFPQQIQPLITKELLLSIWDSATPEKRTLQKYVPECLPPQSPQVLEDKNQWVLKPINGRWSQGVYIGFQTDQSAFTQAWRNPQNIAQCFIQPAREWFFIRKGENNFQQEPLYARVEGYYVKDNNKWTLADSMATCTPTIPVHGMRECIMIPAKIN